MTENDKLKLDNQLCFSLYALSREVIKMYQQIGRASCRERV